MSQIVYSLILFVLNSYKWIELGIIRVFYPYVKAHVVKLYNHYGIVFNGPGDIDIQIKKDKEKEFFVRMANNAPLGMGETYMEGFWDVKDLDGFFEHVFRRKMYRPYLYFINRVYNYLLFNLCNLQSKERAFEIGEQHYDLGNELFETFLDPSMNYSCAYWKNATTLEEAQQHKMNLIGRKLKLEPGMRVLDIGCGWGGLAKHLAQNFNVHVVGCTVSKEQQARTREYCKDVNVDIQLIDYRELTGKYDRIVSIAMFEAVGSKNYREFFEVVRRCLKPDGIFLLHTIGISDSYGPPRIEPWYHKYIFPNGYLPIQEDIIKSSDKLFILEDWHNFGNDYSKTLTVWRERFVKNWPTISHLYSEKFFKMWYYYLSSSIGAFRSRRFQLWQVVFSPEGVNGGYESER